MKLNGNKTVSSRVKIIEGRELLKTITKITNLIWRISIRYSNIFSEITNLI